ncbi:MAG: hypothetical protein LUF27_10910 [Lachnospiraceae bacterium]|nr:hypothetical protein [Lachnospiraceae bacterium]
MNQLARLDEESELYREIRAALFTMQGIDLTEIQQKYGSELEQKAAEMIRQMETEGNVCFRDGKWVLTDAGAVNFL